MDLTTFVKQFPKEGETVFAPNFDLGFGGKGANQAVAARLCGADVSMITCVGNDLFGNRMIENFNKLNIDANFIKQIEKPTGVASILVEPNGQNRILIVKGANDFLKPKDIKAIEEELKAFDCIILQFEIPIETINYVIKFAKKNKIKCILNPAPAQEFDKSILKGLDYFIPNETEAEKITGMVISDFVSVLTCGYKLLKYGPKNIIITLGEKGSVLFSKDIVESIPSYKVKTKDSSGAGDAFIGSLAVFLIEVCEKEAIKKANLYAALSTTGIGTQKSFYSREKFDKEWELNKK